MIKLINDIPNNGWSYDGFIIPAKMFQGDLGELYKKDKASWDSLVQKERDMYNERLKRKRE